MHADLQQIIENYSVQARQSAGKSEATIDSILTCEAWDGLLTKDLLVFGTGRSKLGVSAIEESLRSVCTPG